MYACMCVRTYVCMYVMYVCMYVMYVCMYAWMHGGNVMEWNGNVCMLCMYVM